MNPPPPFSISGVGTTESLYKPGTSKDFTGNDASRGMALFNLMTLGLGKKTTPVVNAVEDGGGGAAKVGWKALNDFDKEGAAGVTNSAALGRSAEWFDDIARNATRNPDSDKLVFGHFSSDSVSYQKVAAHYEEAYFKFDDWNTVTKGLSQDEIWKINESFLDQQVMQGKQILFSHDPLKARATSFFEREVNYLRELGYGFGQKNQWTWEAVR